MIREETFRTGETADVIIVGGGVIGLAVARSIALRGIPKVTLIERATLGAEASFAAAGMLAPQAEADCADEFFNLACKSRNMYAAFSEALREETGIDIELDTTGTLYLAFSELEYEEIEKRYNWQTRAGLAVERLTTEEARRLEPCIPEQVVGSLRFPSDVQVENRRLLAALSNANQRLGVRLLTGTNVNSVRINRRRVEGVETSRGLIGSPCVVIAAGAWTPLIRASDEAMPNVRIEPVRGQMLCFAAKPRIARHVIYSPRGYIVPRLDGRLLAGSTSEQAGFDKHVTAGGTYEILTHLLEIAPSFSHLLILDSWAGLRPWAQDDLPVLGPCAEIEGLFYATGHYRNGILLAPITGELIAAAIAGNVSSPLLMPFSPDRFHLVGVN
jgi:glycine oxidase